MIGTNVFKSLSYQGIKEVDDYKKRKEFTCPKCARLFKPTKIYQLFCSSSCQNIHDNLVKELEDKKLNANCTNCGLAFRVASNKKPFCYACLKYKQKLDTEERLKLKPAKQKTINKKKISHEELNRRSEYKRVWDDSGWNHYLKGRTWNRI